MPCKFCKLSSHTLAKCDSSLIGDLVTTVRALLTDSHLNIREQVDLLKNFSVTQLTVVCRYQRNLPTNRNKNALLSYVIIKHFERSTGEVMRTFDPVLTTAIDDSYTQLSDWVPPENDADIKTRILFNMDIYYLARYGCMRYGHPINTYHRILQDLLLQRQMQPNQHLNKLSITVSVLPELSIEECCCCLEDQQMSQLNCGHRCCSMCVINIAKKRTKSFICCPLCRAEISTVQIVNTNSLNNLNTIFIRC